MTKSQQILFVRELSEGVMKEVIDQIDQGKIPSSWDGHELRCLLGYKHRLSAEMTVIHGEPRSRRTRAFKNEILVKNL